MKHQTNNFCTLFDANYLTRGLAMYKSLIAAGDDIDLYVFCFDELTFNVLNSLNLLHLHTVSLADFESDELLRVKGERSRAEYCWTCTPYVIAHCLERFSLLQVTYLDADLYFFGSPTILLDEFTDSHGSVLLTDHRYAPPYQQAYKAGIFCVQFMTFKCDERGMVALDWWRARCLEWCYARYEDGKFGDQKYLDDWLERFKGVHVLEHPGGGVAPWNIQQYSLHMVDGNPYVDGNPLIFYHFHQYRYFQDGSHDLCDYYKLPGVAVNTLYRPYVKALREAEVEVKAICPGFDQGYSVKANPFKECLLSFYRRLKGTYNVFRSI